MQIAFGGTLAAAAALAALRARALDRSGALAAFVVGTVAFGIGGWPAALVLLAFFIPSSLLSRVGRRQKAALTNAGKSGARDALQVVANGGVAALAVLASLRFEAVALVAFAGALAAASADTWGTEIGTLVGGTPRSILSWKRLDRGLSGGVTVAGSAAEICGAAVVASVAALLHVAPFVPALAGGIAGALADSILGACIQELRHCPACALDCETNPHECGTPTSLRRGVSWMGNDAVNLAATASGAALAAAVFLL